MSTIPASELVAINPSVLAAAGGSLDVIALVLTTSTQAPVGSVLSFADAPSVGDYFGASSVEKTVADTYFSGFDGKPKIPGSLLFTQYNETAVAAYLRGADISAMTLAELQALSGSLNIVVDGYARNASSVVLSAATSFSSGAGIIETALNAAIATIATLTGALGGVFTGSITGTVLTISAVTNGALKVGDTISGTGVTAGTTIASLGTGTGGTGTYNVSVTQTVGSTTITGASNILVVSAVASGTIAIGQTVDSTGTDAIITALGTGTGGTGTYTIGGSPQTVASGTMTTKGTPVDVTYDSVSGGFVIASTVTGAVSTAAFATGTIADDLLLRSADGAVLSQGAALAVPAAFMDAVVVEESNWVTFMTAFDPDVADANTVKQAFAAWVTAQNDRFAYICFDTDTGPTLDEPDAGSLGQILAAAENSGTCLIWAPTEAEGIELAAFVCGTAASIDFTERNGRITFAFKKQAGITASVTTSTIAQNLGGNPQSSGRGNGYNFYGAYGAANANFTWFQRGFVTGDFLWLDSYINQIQLNSSLQVALLTLMENARSIPYNQAGNGKIESALADPIAAALNFGSCAPGTISQAQRAEVNESAGANIANTLETQGYYLQILLADSTVRAARGSPPCTFWYLDRGSVQAISLSSIAVE